MPGRILVVDDDLSMCELIADGLRPRGFEVTYFTSAEEAIAEARTTSHDAILTDLRMPDLNGIELCTRLSAGRPDIPVVVMTAFGSLESAVGAIRAGAYDFVTKPIELEALAITVDRAVKHRALLEKIETLTRAAKDADRFEELVGESPPMQNLYRQLHRIADSEASVLITGESGTGKELVARGLHRRSARRDGPFIAVNCAALPEALLESELFGHTRGAFTDAAKARKGVFMEADGGTLFLDEIGELPRGLQPKLLRALEERALRPVGSDKEVPFDVRLVSATNRDLDAAVREGRFREDLFFRINVIQIEVPALRVRGTDILLLAQHFLEQFAARSAKPVKGISSSAAEKLLGYEWRGNVRELRNAIERAVALTSYDKIVADDLPEKIRDYNNRNFLIGSDDPADLVPMEEVERRYIFHVLRSAGDNKTIAARILGFDRKTLYRKIQKYADESKKGDDS